MDFLSKRSTINQNLEQLIIDIPAYILIMENLSDRVDEKLGWKEFKFCFKLATSQIVSMFKHNTKVLIVQSCFVIFQNGVIVKLLDHKSALRDSISNVGGLIKVLNTVYTLRFCPHCRYASGCRSTNSRNL